MITIDPNITTPVRVQKRQWRPKTVDQQTVTDKPKRVRLARLEVKNIIPTSTVCQKTSEVADITAKTDHCPILNIKAQTYQQTKEQNRMSRKDCHILGVTKRRDSSEVRRSVIPRIPFVSWSQASTRSSSVKIPSSLRKTQNADTYQENARTGSEKKDITVHVKTDLDSEEFDYELDLKGDPLVDKLDIIEQNHDKPIKTTKSTSVSNAKYTSGSNGGSSADEAGNSYVDALLESLTLQLKHLTLSDDDVNLMEKKTKPKRKYAEITDDDIQKVNEIILCTTNKDISSCTKRRKLFSSNTSYSRTY